jgi:hypothetical protein
VLGLARSSDRIVVRTCPCRTFNLWLFSQFCFVFPRIICCNYEFQHSAYDFTHLCNVDFVVCFQRADKEREASDSPSWPDQAEEARNKGSL